MTKTGTRALILFALALPAVSACGALLAQTGDDEEPPRPGDDRDAALDVENSSDASGANDAPSDAGVDGRTKDANAACPAPPCERFVFVTSKPFRGDLGGLLGADNPCNQLAAAGDARLKGRTFVAYLAQSTGQTISAGSRLNANGPPFKRLDGTIVAQDRDQFMNGPLSAPIEIDENGNQIIGALVWTGAQIGGGPSGFDCSAWSTRDAGRGTYGTALANAVANGEWVDTDDVVCSESLRLYCVEQ